MTKKPARVEPQFSGAASINAVAKRAGVSIATVSRVVNGVSKKASPATIARVREAVAALDYRPASAGRALRQRSSRLVAVLAANLGNPAMAAIAASAEIALREAGLVMVLCDTHDKPELQDQYLREMQAQQAKAIVLLGAVDSPLLRKLQDGPTPLVFVNRRNPSGGDGAFVGIDNCAAGADAARWALGQGMTTVALIHGPLSSSATRDRVAGILAACEQAGQPIKPRLILSPMRPDHLQIGQAAAKMLVRVGRRIDLAICVSDLIAYGVMRGWRESLSPSSAPRLLGFDDTPLNEWLAPELSSVRIPYESYGPAIVSMLLDEGPERRRILEHRIVERDNRRF